MRHDVRAYVLVKGIIVNAKINCRSGWLLNGFMGVFACNAAIGKPLIIIKLARRARIVLINDSYGYASL